MKKFLVYLGSVEQFCYTMYAEDVPGVQKLIKDVWPTLYAGRKWTRNRDVSKLPVGSVRFLVGKKPVLIIPKELT